MTAPLPPGHTRRPGHTHWEGMGACRQCPPVAANARRLAWFTDRELRAELDRRALDGQP